MDQFTRRIVGIGIHLRRPSMDRHSVGFSIKPLVGRARLGISVPNHDPLFEFHRWKANLRVLEVTEIKKVPCVPVSHPFIERLIGTVRREFLESRTVLEHT